MNNTNEAVRTGEVAHTPPNNPNTFPKMNIDSIKHDCRRLRDVVAGDTGDLSIAYPILARHGFMDRTPNGYRAISPGAVLSRSRELIAQLEAAQAQAQVALAKGDQQ